MVLMSNVESKLLKEAGRIEKTEEKILKQEQTISKVIGGDQFQTLLQNAEILTKVERTRRFLVRRIAKHKFIFTLIVATGIILVWRGVWEITAVIPILSQSIVALLLGVTILWLIERYTDLH